MSVPHETVEKLQSYAFRPTGKRKDYKYEETSEGRCNYSSASERRFFHFRSVFSLEMAVSFSSFQVLRQMKTFC